MRKITVPNDKKMVFLRLLTIKRCQQYEYEDFPQLLDKSCQYRKEDFKNKLDYVLKEYITSKKVKIIEALCMKENN